MANNYNSNSIGINSNSINNDKLTFIKLLLCARVVPNASLCYLIKSSQPLYEVGTVVISILDGELRQKEPTWIVWHSKL